jgi:uncharacterized phage-associated protein
MNHSAISVARYILDRLRAKGDAVTPMQLIKLVYVAQGYMLGRFGRPLFREAVQAWEYGPVVPSVYHAVKQYRSSPVTHISEMFASGFNFDASELGVLDYVADAYGPIDGLTLSNATHQPGTPWSTTWLEAGQNAPISNDVIEHFYRQILQQPSHSAL